MLCAAKPEVAQELARRFVAERPELAHAKVYQYEQGEIDLSKFPDAAHLAEEYTKNPFYRELLDRPAEDDHHHEDHLYVTLLLSLPRVSLEI